MSRFFAIFITIGIVFSGLSSYSSFSETTSFCDSQATDSSKLPFEKNGCGGESDESEDSEEDSKEELLTCIYRNKSTNNFETSFKLTHSFDYKSPFLEQEVRPPRS